MSRRTQPVSARPGRRCRDDRGSESVELAILLFPGLAAVVGMAFMAPMGIYEVSLGLWLLVKGLR